jgi:hypothetical protein
MSWLDVAKDSCLDSKKVYLKKNLSSFLEVLTQSANFLWLSQDIDYFQDIFDTFYIKFCTFLIEKKISEKF